MYTFAKLNVGVIYLIYDIEKFEPKANEAYLFDTNIWLYLYSRVTQYSYYIKEIFSEFMYKCVGVGAKIYVTSLIISEFYNTAMRIEYKTHQTDMYKKGFRNDQTLGDDLIGIIKYCILSKAEKSLVIILKSLLVMILSQVMILMIII